MGMREKMSKVLLKDVYERVQNNEITKYEFQQWLSMYAFKHYNRGMDTMEKICGDVMNQKILNSNKFDMDGRC